MTSVTDAVPVEPLQGRLLNHSLHAHAWSQTPRSLKFTVAEDQAKVYVSAMSANSLQLLGSENTPIIMEPTAVTATQGPDRLDMANQNPLWAAASQAMYNQAMQQQQQGFVHGLQHQPQHHALYSDSDQSIISTFNLSNFPSTYRSPRVAGGAVMYPHASCPGLQARERHHLAASSGLFAPSNTPAPYAATPSDACARSSFSTLQNSHHQIFPSLAAAQPALNPEAAATAMYEGMSSGTLSDYDMLVLAHAAGLINDQGDLVSTDDGKQGESSCKQFVIPCHDEASSKCNRGNRSTAPLILSLVDSDNGMWWFQMS